MSRCPTKKGLAAKWAKHEAEKLRRILAYIRMLVRKNGYKARRVAQIMLPARCLTTLQQQCMWHACGCSMADTWGRTQLLGELKSLVRMRSKEMSGEELQDHLALQGGDQQQDRLALQGAGQQQDHLAIQAADQQQDHTHPMQL